VTVRRRIALAVFAVAVLLLAGRAITGVYVDYRWYQALGAGEVWRTQFTTSVWLRLASAALATLFVFANLYAVRHSVVSLVLPRRLANLEIGEEVPGRHLVLAAAVLSALCGSALALPREAWTSYLLARAGQPFGEGDPYFDHDLGFFVYWLPFERTLYVWALVTVAVLVTVVLGLYALTPSLRLARGRLYVSTYVRRHLTVLGGVLLLLLAWSFRLDMYRVLSAGSGEAGAFSFVDHQVAIPGNLVLAVVTLGAALVVVWSGWTGQIRLAFFAVTAVLGLALIVKQLAPAVATRVADAEPAARERPYITTRALYARRAFGVDRVVADTSLGYASVADLARGVAVWDAPAIVRALERSRPGRAFAATLGWHADERGLTALVAERPATAGVNGPVPWSVVRVLASGADDNGNLVRLGDGEPLAGPAVIHDTSAGPIAVADPEGRIVGTEVSGRFSRLAHAWALQESRLLWDDLPAPRPVLVVRRGVRDRVRALAPFFAQGTLVSPLVVADSLYWAVDLYSASRYYPLSDPVTLAGEELSYLRHAAVALVDAATGRVRLVADSVLDPIALTWRREFPALFTDWSAVRADLRNQMQPGPDGLEAQAVAFARYAEGPRNPAVRRLPPNYGADTSALADSRPIFAVPTTRAVATAVPVLDEADHVAGLLVATGGARALIRWYPARGRGPRWGAVLAELRPSDGRPPRDAALARGPVRAVPAAGALAFIQPAYAWHLEGAPQLVQTSLLLADSVRVGASLQDLAGPRGGAPGQRPPADLRATIGRLYEAMRRAAREGDWPAFGRAFDSIGTVLGRPRQ
jgi:uncharacterized membrane protein (UPF0182 family)